MTGDGWDDRNEWEGNLGMYAIFNPGMSRRYTLVRECDGRMAPEAFDTFAEAEETAINWDGESG